MSDYVKFLNYGRKLVMRALSADKDARKLFLKAVAHFRSWHRGPDFANMNRVAERMLRRGFFEDAIAIFGETGNDVALEKLLKNLGKKNEHAEKIIQILKTRPYFGFACCCPLVEGLRKNSNAD